MLTGLRAASETRLGRIILSLVLGVIIVSFAIWGIGNIFQGFGRGEAAAVGRTRVSAAAFQRAYDLQLKRLQAEMRPPITDAQARAMGLDRGVLLRLVANAAINERVRHLGLAATPEQVQKFVLESPLFRDQRGAYDYNTLIERVGEQGYTPKDLPALYTQQQLVAALVSGVATPRTVLEVMNRFEGETRSIQYVTLPATAAGAIPAPSDAELRKFYEGHKEGYRAREYRDIQVLAITPVTLAKPELVSDADAKALYDQEADGRFGQAERRTVQKMTFPSEADAKAAEAKIKAGLRFEDLAKERHVPPNAIEVGTQPKSQLGDIADAAFALPEGGVSDPIKIGADYALVHVTKILPSTLKPFADVAPQLKLQIAKSRVQQKDLDDLHDRIEALRTSGKPLAEAAKALSLIPRDIQGIDAKGRDKAGVPVPDLLEASSLLKAVFASDVGLDNDTLQLASGGYEWFEIRKVEPARDRAFEEVKAEVEKQWRLGEVAKRLSAESAAQVRKLNAGAALASLVPGAEVKTAEGIVRSRADKLPQKLVEEVFATPVGSGSAVDGDDGNRIIFKVVSAAPPHFDATAPSMRRASANYAEALNGDIVRQFASRLEDEYGLTVNQGVLRAPGGADAPMLPLDQD